MEQEIEELGAAVREVQNTNNEILSQLSSIQELDSQVCTCPCHNAKAGPNVTKELRDHTIRIEALEKLVEDLLTRDRVGGIDSNHSSLGYNVTDEYKQRHDVREERNLSAESRALSGERSQDVAQRKLNDKGCTDEVEITLDDSPENAVSEPRTERRKTTLHGRERTEIDQTGLANDSQKVRERVRKPQPRSKSEPQAQRTGKMNRGGNIIRPNIPTRSQSKTVHVSDTSLKSTQPDTTSDADNLGSGTGEGTRQPEGDAGAEGMSSGALAEEGAVADPEAEDDPVEVEVIHQDESRLFAQGREWTSLAQMELDSGQATALKQLEGAHTAICLDISESMAKGKRWRQAKKFLLAFINELINVAKEHGVKDEYVSFVTFGHETRVVRRMTNKYEELVKAVESVKLGGPSPMYGGLYMALASLIQSENHTTTVNDMTVHSKIILISDGILTDTRQQAGPDIMESKETPLPSKNSADLVLAAADVLRRGIDIYCVQVEDAAMDVMMAVASDENRIWSCDDGVKHARRYFLTKASAPGLLRGLFGPSFNPNFKSDIQLSPGDRLYMLEIVNEANRRRMDELTRTREVEDMYAETDNDRLLMVGSRVRRGPDWDEGGHLDEDDNGPGTVVGHCRFRDAIWVEWDCGDTPLSYRCGESNAYDVLLADDVRKPNPDGNLAPGCVVKPNDLTKIAHPNIQAFDRGVVITTNKPKVGVRWNSGKKTLHEYIPGVIQEVTFCGTSDSSDPGLPREEREKKQSRPKNKNKK